MPTDLKAILAAKDKYPDETKITLADGVEVTLGDLRTFDTSRDGDVRGQLEQIGQREAALGQLANELTAMQAKLNEAAQRPAQNIDPRIQALTDLLTGKSGKPSIFDDTPEYFKPLMSRLDEYKASIEAQKAALEAQRKDVETTVTWHARRQLERDYKYHRDWPEGFDIKKAVSYAQQNKYVDEMGFPDFDRVHDAVLAPTRDKARIEDERKKIRAEEREAARKETRATPRDAFVPLPNGNGGGPGGNGGGKRYGGIEKVADSDILSDPDILNTFNMVQ